MEFGNPGLTEQGVMALSGARPYVRDAAARHEIENNRGTRVGMKRWQKSRDEQQPLRKALDSNGG